MSEPVFSRRRFIRLAITGGAGATLGAITTDTSKGQNAGDRAFVGGCAGVMVGEAASRFIRGEVPNPRSGNMPTQEYWDAQDRHALEERKRRERSGDDPNRLP